MRTGWLLLAILAAGCSRAPVAERSAAAERAPTVRDSEIVTQFLARKERWAVKTGADPGAACIDVRRPVRATVAQLIALPRPPDMPGRSGIANDRYGPVETTVYQVDVEILRYKLESDDEDLHVVVRDPGGKRTMVVEFADPSVVSRRSPFWPQIRDARAAFYAKLKPTTKWKRGRTRATITGVGFFDFRHGQSGLAPNGIELHPVLDVRF